MKRFFNTLFAVLTFCFLGANAAFASNGLEVHFLNVGQADAAFITCDGHSMLIDGGNSGDSQLIYSYLKNQNVSFLDYIVATHDDADHVGGLSAAAAYAGPNIGQVFAPYTDSEKERFQTFKRKLSENGKTITVPQTGTSYDLGGAKFQILAGVGTGKNASIVLRLTYGEHSFLFMGDAEAEQEKAILDRGSAVESTVLKVGHHGSNTSTCYQFLRAVYPKYAVVSVGKDNTYGHPTDEVLSRLRDCGTSVFRTDNNGTIIFKSDGKQLSYTSEKPVDFAVNLVAAGTVQTLGTNQDQKGSETAVETNKNASGARTYVLNTNTHKFHVPGCSSVSQMKEKNKRTVEDSRDSIISQGYEPCKRCNP